MAAVMKPVAAPKRTAHQGRLIRSRPPATPARKPTAAAVIANHGRSGLYIAPPRLLTIPVMAPASGPKRAPTRTVPIVSPKIGSFAVFTISPPTQLTAAPTTKVATKRSGRPPAQCQLSDLNSRTGRETRRWGRTLRCRGEARSRTLRRRHRMEDDAGSSHWGTPLPTVCADATAGSIHSSRRARMGEGLFGAPGAGPWVAINPPAVSGRDGAGSNEQLSQHHLRRSKCDEAFLNLSNGIPPRITHPLEEPTPSLSHQALRSAARFGRRPP